MTGPGGVVRAAEPRELDRLTALFTVLIAEHEAYGPGWRMRPGAEAALRARLEERLTDADGVLLVFDRGGDLPGLCAGRVLRRPPGFEETVRGEVEHLVVREGARRAGIGRVLAEGVFAELRARGAARVEVQVARGNAEASRFWRALGFAPTMDVLDRPL